MRERVLGMTRRGGLAGLALALTTLVGGGRAAEPEAPRFEAQILPILRANCVKCHDDATRKGGLDLRSVAGLLKGGDQGPAVVHQAPDESPLLEQVATQAMPPGKAAKLSEDQVGLIRAWIERGDPSEFAAAPVEAADRPLTPEEQEFWAFRPPTRPDVPGPADPGANPVDAFLAVKLDAAGLGFSPEADRPTLIRRLTHDLWGLPPTPEEVDAFVADGSPDAYGALVDRLLASPRYGERWGRHWLDVAGYADSEGILDADYIRAAAWRYRDYVIRSFNADKPYDRFLREQIAGDELTGYWAAYESEPELPPGVVEGLEATGFLRCASDTSRPDFVNIKNAPGYYYQTLDDTMKIVASATMGLTLQCAKCHTHKYDPITHEEYYRFQSIFMSAYRPAQWVPQVERKRAEATAKQEAEAKAHNEAVDAQVAERRVRIERLRASFQTRLFEKELAALPEVIREDVKAALDAGEKERNEVQKYLVAKFRPLLRPEPNEVDARLKPAFPEYAEQLGQHEAAIAAAEATRKSFPEIRAIYDLPGAPKTPILLRGDYLAPSREVAPGVPRSLATPQAFAWSAPAAEARTSGRRLAFAEWLTQPDHPLTARVLVNRVWLHHFGEGIVATPDNFGTTGSPPSHPELLDWLATRFVDQGWSVKGLHRLILTSRAYRQSSRVDPDQHAKARAVDPENRLLWRQRLRRREAEALRDSILSVAGTLNPTMFGPPVAVVGKPDGEITTPAGPEGDRRSIYLQVRRSQPITLLQVFDQPVMETNCTQRVAATVASQALTLLNSDDLTRQSEAYAARVLKEDPRDPARRALRLAWSRSPAGAEEEAMAAFLASQSARHRETLPEDRARQLALADLCQMLLSSNEFAYID